MLAVLELPIASVDEPSVALGVIKPKANVAPAGKLPSWIRSEVVIAVEPSVIVARMRFSRAP